MVNSAPGVKRGTVSRSRQRVAKSPKRYGAQGTVKWSSGGERPGKGRQKFGISKTLSKRRAKRESIERSPQNNKEKGSSSDNVDDISTKSTTLDDGEYGASRGPVIESMRELMDKQEKLLELRLMQKEAEVQRLKKELSEVNANDVPANVMSLEAAIALQGEARGMLGMITDQRF